ncbi:MAG: hypothetical protein C0621_10270 [Desulfuromonas sp.]|nr:MAG: hypothetical protein C0621_10270 [Desulfuromonas sp.]
MMILQRLLLAFLLLFPLMLTPAADAAVVLVDQGHGQRFRVDGEGELDLSKLATILNEQGCELRLATTPLDAEALTGVDAVITSGAFLPYKPDELKDLFAFVEAGGKLAVMLHIAPTYSPLMGKLGVFHSNGVIHEQDAVIKENDLNFKVTHLEASPLTDGLQSFSLYGGWALLSGAENSRIVARSGERSWVDLNGDKKLGEGDAMQSLGVIIYGTQGAGEFAIFGDDAIFQNRFLDATNQKLARNLGSWLARP